MYWNDTHVLIYFAVAIIGGIIGQIIDYLNKTFVIEQKILAKNSFRKYKLIARPNYLLIVLNAILYVALLYKYKVSLEFFKFAPLVSMLISVFVVDFQAQIIPNRLNLTIFELGLLFAFSLGNSNLNIATDAVLGMLIGGGIFLTIAIIGGVIAGKDAMGLGDVKLMGAIGLYFGKANIIKISILAFLVGAIISIVLLITKKNRKDGYVPFGPFIVIAAIIILFTPASILDTALLKIFSLGLA